MFASVVLLLVASGSAKAGPPAWFDRMLAGYELQYDQKHGQAGVYDAKTGYFLIRDIECDGGIVSVFLTRDRHMVSNASYKVPNFTPNPDEGAGSQPLTNKPLSSLSTGKGVTIGFSRAQMEAKLGKPTQVKHSGPRKQFVDCIYRWQDKPGEEGITYEETYTFKEGKLIQIEFLKTANDLPGKG